MQLATGANMLNFGYWVDDVKTPIETQTKLCMMVGRISELDSSKSLVDVGSGFAHRLFFGKMYLTHRYFV